MTSIISKCSICDQFFDSKKKLRDHKDKDHRITDLKMISVLLTENQTKQATAVKRRYQEEENI
jgi:hypothetical protein